MPVRHQKYTFDAYQAVFLVNFSLQNCNRLNILFFGIYIMHWNSVPETKLDIVIII